MCEKDVGLPSYLLHPKFVRISRELSLHLTPVITRHMTSAFHVKKTSLQRLLPAGLRQGNQLCTIIINAKLKTEHSCFLPVK